MDDERHVIDDLEFHIPPGMLQAPSTEDSACMGSYISSCQRTGAGFKCDVYNLVFTFTDSKSSPPPHDLTLDDIERDHSRGDLAHLYKSRSIC